MANIERTGVSDHAVLRWLERYYEIDIEKIRRDIGAICGPAIRLGASSLTAHGMRFVITGGVVTTCLTIDMHKRNRGKTYNGERAR